ncbi:hypothetical protein TNCV_1407381 [Trichonephila clavipes]|nr:hypothetical protein TNCV_1407381 [Trichonephila clavipes]
MFQTTSSLVTIGFRAEGNIFVIEWRSELDNKGITWEHGTLPLSAKGDIEDASSELDIGFKGGTSWMKRPELYCFP